MPVEREPPERVGDDPDIHSQGAKTPAEDPGFFDRGERPSRGPSDRLPFDRIVPELLKRGFEAGRGTSMPREIAAYLVGQFSDAREGIVSAVAQEVGRFLRQADIASELRNVLTGMEVEASVRLNFRRKKEEGSTAPPQPPRQEPPDTGAEEGSQAPKPPR